MSDYIAISKEVHKRWNKEVTSNKILYLYAMTGYGKSEQALVFAKENFKKYSLISAKDNGFIEKVEVFIEENEKPKFRTLLILDDLQYLRKEEDQKILFELLNKVLKTKPRAIRILILSRAVLPAYLIPLQMTKQLVVEGKESLMLDKEHIGELIIKDGILDVVGEDKLYSLVQKAELVTKGYGLAVNSFLLRIRQYPKDEETAVALAKKDVYSYIETHLFRQWPATTREAAITLSIFDEFSEDMAEELLGTDAKKIINDFMSIGSFLTFKAPNIYRYNPFFLLYLKEKLRSRSHKELKIIYENAAKCYEKRRDYKNLLHCYKEAGRTDKVVDCIIFLSENADGCSFAKISDKYLEEIPLEWEERQPRIIGAKAMLAAYRMEPEKSRRYIAKLKKVATEKKNGHRDSKAVEAYIRTLIACPCGTSEEIKNNFRIFASYVRKHGLVLNHIMPTGNMPSLINGGLDLLSWEKKKTILYLTIKTASELFMGKEAVGIADASMGEIYYEQNNKTKAMTSLTKAISAANLKGSVRVQYAATGIMARIFISEKEMETAVTTLKKMRKKARKEHFSELLPNIDASLVQCALYSNDVDTYMKWLDKNAVSEYDDFYITFRYQLFIKAKVYVALGKEMEALYIIGILKEYAHAFKRIYFNIDLFILEAIILYRRKENWQEVLLKAIEQASEYGLIRIFADYGAALLPLWREIKWEGGVSAKDLLIEESSSKIIVRLDEQYINKIRIELSRMARQYPNYLKKPRQFARLTDKELVVLKLISTGLNNNQLAKELGLSLGTVKFHVKNIMSKLEAENRTVAVKIAQEAGIL